MREGVRTGRFWSSYGVVVYEEDIQPCNSGIISMEQNHWETGSRSVSWDSPHFVELEASSPYLQKPALCSYPEPEETSLLHIVFLYDGQLTTVVHKWGVCLVDGLMVLVSTVEVMFVKRLLHVTVTSEYVILARLFVYRDFICVQRLHFRISCCLHLQYRSEGEGCGFQGDIHTCLVRQPASYRRRQWGSHRTS